MFCRSTSEIKWKRYKKRRKSAEQNTYFQNAQKRMRREAHLCKYLDWSTNVGEALGQPPAHLPKAVASGAWQGAATPWVQSHYSQHGPGPFFFGGFIQPCIGGSWWLPCLAAPNRRSTSLTRWVRLIFKTHNIWSQTLHYLLYSFYF
jgi:hypothetical protein